MRTESYPYLLKKDWAIISINVIYYIKKYFKDIFQINVY